MASDPKFSNPFDREIYETHRLFLKVMENDRLPTISDETKASYLAVFKSLTEKLCDAWEATVGSCRRDYVRDRAAAFSGDAAVATARSRVSIRYDNQVGIGAGRGGLSRPRPREFSPRTGCPQQVTRAGAE